MLVEGIQLSAIPDCQFLRLEVRSERIGFEELDDWTFPPRLRKIRKWRLVWHPSQVRRQMVPKETQPNEQKLFLR